MPRLVINADSEAASEIPLSPGTYSVGRSPENNLCLEHDSISSFHAQLTVGESEILLRDLGSTSGTYVNGELVEQIRLLPGQTFSLGEVRIRFESDTAPAAAIPLPPPVSARPERKAFPRARATPSRAMRPLAANVIPRQPFLKMLGGAFAYPFVGDGIMLLIAGGLFYGLVGFVEFVGAFGGIFGTAAIGFVGVFGTGYLISFLRRILLSSAMGERLMPDWPDFTDLGSDILAPIFQWLGTMVACLIPALIVAFTLDAGSASRSWALVAAYAFGCIYFPMAYLAVCMFDSIAAVNPLLVMPSIVKVPGEYALTVSVLAAVLVARWAGNLALALFLPTLFLPGLISSFLSLYLLIVEVRILGLLYYARKSELGWFAR